MHPIEQFAFEFNIQEDYFECHEVLEELWQAGGRTDESLVALIQLAVARYHHRRGNLTGALRTYPKAFQKIERHAASLTAAGIDAGRLIELKDTFMTNDYQRIELPIDDHLARCLTKQSLEPLDRPFLVDKHRLRNRQDVIDARQAALVTRGKWKNRS
ncbi:DUF309 domain-containing protein [Exiguobacterium sp. s193]|uniref:DUF309 domain-containing protein n=1 Tax=Exiguobacterium sp. s193 TaxID=2751207 RepID=UPI001BE7FD78|nr:DUF309 domain-containing protein [Exiguobacterium sp. s193]